MARRKHEHTMSRKRVKKQFVSNPPPHNPLDGPCSAHPERHAPRLPDTSYPERPH